ncbi:hypothetical protein JG687_00011780 [Phytophthora cactorum]|uniref:Uncharacterized protein n=2 Tax=Phytophthora TaxID=4783 RepID=A0A8J5M1T0_9STRA|nr:hypothetical protein GQ600_14330 [Phytophthora cactorum]KAG6953751.1 hypothetical protein JG688_00012673 [Phytophthora aleatoria]KAG6954506.1 hypothetical protein JG687_00011780 [Phytophthora cactorum]
MSTITKEQHDELCVAYASMILFDAEHEITSESIQQIVHASGNEKAKEEEEEADLGGGMDMFGGDEDY